MRKKNSIKHPLILLPLLFLLSSCDGQPFDSQQFLDKLFGNFWALLINLGALIVLFIIVFFVAYKPLKKYLDARKDHIEHEMRDAETAKKIYQKKADEGDALVAEAKKQADEIVVEAKENASKISDKIVEEANVEAARRLEEAKKEIALEEERAQDEIHEQIVEVALTASEKVLGREIDREENSRLVDDFASTLESEDK